MRKWHRYSGLIAAVFILNLSITGILLNHPTLFEGKHDDAQIQHRITHTATHPSSPNTLWIGTEKGLYVSHDAGVTTTKVMVRYPDIPVTDIYIDPVDSNELYVSFKKHLLIHSNNAGRTWSRIDLPPSIERLYSVTKDKSALLLTSDDGIFRLQDQELSDVLRTGSSAQFMHTIRALHSGYFFAPLLIWLHDLTAVILITLTITGIVMFLRLKRRV